MKTSRTSTHMGKIQSSFFGGLDPWQHAVAGSRGYNVTVGRRNSQVMPLLRVNLGQLLQFLSDLSFTVRFWFLMILMIKARIIILGHTENRSLGETKPANTNLGWFHLSISVSHNIINNIWIYMLILLERHFCLQASIITPSIRIKHYAIHQ